MALRSTIHKAQLSVADLDRGHYADHALTLARHPSETEERMMVRLLAFGLHADEALAFGPGLSSEGEPDLALRDDTGRLRLWIEVGLPDEKWVRKAASQADRVVLIAYGGARADLWWRGNAAALARHEGLRVLACDEAGTRALAALAGRTMRLSITIQEGQALVSDGAASPEIAITVLKAGAADESASTDRR
jgi:uncharacterized protein YaeQ